MRIVLAAAVLLVAACTKDVEPVAEAPAAAPPPAAEPAPAPEPVAMTGMTAEDPGGLTEDGFTFHTRPGSKHVVRLPAPGTDTWKAATAGEPTVKQTGTRAETGPDGKPAIVFEYEMLQSGNAAIEFQRMEDGEVEGKRTINFMVH